MVEDCISVGSRKGLGDDIRLAQVVMRNEIRKFVSGKKLLVIVGLTGAILAMMICVPYLTGGSLSSDPKALASSMTYTVSMIILLEATLLGSTSLVSEFEERTALILFTKPIRKSSIFMGKYVASVLVSTAVIIGYYLVTAVVSLAVTGTVCTELVSSLAMSVCAILGCTGVSMLISILAKKASTASILTFVTLLLLFSVISSALVSSGIDAWWMLDVAMGAITSSFNASSADLIDAGLVMILWSVVTAAVSFLFFRKRDF